ncbi:type II secretion system protein N [Polaromonas sp.]|uniref:type II secretion system protein N n=1 Tax=Polaromonas sp. TaxID=1869339 RepID=UPI003753C3A9
MLHTTKNSRPLYAATPWRWAVFGALWGLVVAAVLLAPAGWLAAALYQATAGRAQLVETVGTVWTGSGRLVLTGGSGSRDSAALPGRVNWKLRPDGFALGLALSAACCTPQPMRARAQPRWGGVRLQIFDSASEWPAPLLSGLGAPWNTVRAGGQLQLMTQDLTLEWLNRQPVLAGRAELTALGLTSSLTTLKPMGSYQLSLTGGTATELKLATLEGSLQLAGSGRWVGSRLSFQGIATAAPEHEAALANLLNIIGRRDGARSIITLG